MSDLIFIHFQHPLFSINTPSISVCLSFSQIKKLQNDCIDYLKEATQVCGKPLTVRDIFIQRAEKKREFIKQVEIRHKENFEKWKGKFFNLFNFLVSLSFWDFLIRSTCLKAGGEVDLKHYSIILRLKKQHC